MVSEKSRRGRSPLLWCLLRSLPLGTNLFNWLVTLWEEYSGCSSVNQRLSHQSPRLATFSVTGKERLSHLRIPGVMIGGDSHLSTPFGADGCSATRSWFQMWAACVSLPCEAHVTGCCSYFLISLRGSAVSTRTVLTMGPSRCIWEGESVIGASQLLESAHTSEAEKGWAAHVPRPQNEPVDEPWKWASGSTTLILSPLVPWPWASPRG